MALPSVNRFLTKKDRERNRRIHRRKLRTIKSSIDNGAPKGFVSGRNRKNPKKERMMEENYQKIERENRLLLKKMSSIMQVCPYSLPRFNRMCSLFLFDICEKEASSAHKHPSFNINDRGRT